MKINQFLFHIPGTEDLFNLEEIERINNKDLLVEIIDNRFNNRTRHGQMNIRTAIQKFR